MGDLRLQSSSHPKDLLFLDGLRGLAAFYVLAGHARWLLWEGYSEGFLKHPDHYGWLGKGLVYSFSFFRYGHEAVLFFFVLSGFVIHLRYARSLASAAASAARFDWGSYVFRRARRLYPPLLAAIILTLALDSLGSWFNFSIYNQATRYESFNTNIVAHHDPVTLLGNLGFLMQAYVPAYGTNGALWSLKFEWWFYMLYPVFWWLTRRSLVLATAAMVALFIASFWDASSPCLLLRQIFSAMLVWWLGVLLADIYAGRWRAQWPWVAGAFTAAGGLGAVLLGGRFHELSVGSLFAGLLAGCFALEQLGVRFRVLQALKPLGDMSYTLYVTHLPLLVLLSGWLQSRSRGDGLPGHFGWVAAGTALALALAYALHFIVERPFQKPPIKFETAPSHG